MFAFGDASFNGSMGGQVLSANIVSIASTWNGGGYWEFGADGGVFAFGDATYAGRAPVSSTSSVASGTVA